MTASFAYSPAPVSHLTDAQLSELSTELLGGVAPVEAWHHARR